LSLVSQFLLVVLYNVNCAGVV
jgi:hypothetical protein